MPTAPKTKQQRGGSLASASVTGALGAGAFSRIEGAGVLPSFVGGGGQVFGELKKGSRYTLHHQSLRGGSSPVALPPPPPMQAPGAVVRTGDVLQAGLLATDAQTPGAAHGLATFPAAQVASRAAPPVFNQAGGAKKRHKPAANKKKPAASAAPKKKPAAPKKKPAAPGMSQLAKLQRELAKLFASKPSKH